MKLILLQDTNGGELEICPVPSSTLSRRIKLIDFLKLHAGRVFGGREGRDWRICTDDRCLVPLKVNQIVVNADGTADYGQELIIK